jgi:hypothetical protein
MPQASSAQRRSRAICYIGRQNIISPCAGIAVSPIQGLTLSLQQYFFWRASDRDAIHNNRCSRDRG